MSKLIDDPLTHDEPKDNADGQEFDLSSNKIMELGVPVLISAGNLGSEKAPEEAVLEDEATPLINVGMEDLRGIENPNSQGSSQLTIHAPGAPVEAQTKRHSELYSVTGTSFAAPIVAGIIATYLAYETPPWNEPEDPFPPNGPAPPGTDFSNRVKEIKRFLKRMIELPGNVPASAARESSGTVPIKPPTRVPKKYAFLERNDRAVPNHHKRLP